MGTKCPSILGIVFLVCFRDCWAGSLFVCPGPWAGPGPVWGEIEIGTESDVK